MLLRRLNNNNKQREKKDINTLVPLSARPLDPTSRCVGVLGSPTHAYFNFMRKRLLFSCFIVHVLPQKNFPGKTSRSTRGAPAPLSSSASAPFFDSKNFPGKTS